MYPQAEHGADLHPTVPVTCALLCTDSFGLGYGEEQHVLLVSVWLLEIAQLS